MFKYKGIDINYKDYGEGSVLVFLHGWGQNIEMMEMLALPLSKNYRVILIDLPGFGKSTEPLEVFSLSDYALMINELLLSLNVSNPTLIGHSFGGKISLVYASLFETSKLILFAPPFRVKKRKLTFKEKLFRLLVKIPNFKFIKNFIKRHVGSIDYRNASFMMRKILVKHVNTDITDIVSSISIPTLIVWGSMDKAVSYMDALLLNKLIKNSRLVTFFNSTHYAYLENLDRTILLMQKFLVS